MWQRFMSPILFLIVVQFGSGILRADESTVFRYKFEKGATQIWQSKTQTKTTQTINGNKLETEAAQTTININSIEEIAAETILLKSKTERLKATAKIPSLGDFEFDSQKPDRDKSSVIGAALTPLYERLVGSELQIEVTPLGKLKSLKGYAQLVGDLTKSNPLTSQFAGGGSDNAAKMGIQAQWIVFPEKPLKPGDHWENPLELELPGLGLIKGKESITFLRLETVDSQTIAKFSTSTDISFDLNVEVNGAKVTGKVTTSNSSGMADFNVVQGKVKSLTSELTLTGDLTIVVNNMTLPVQLTQTVSAGQTALEKLPE